MFWRTVSNSIPRSAFWLLLCVTTLGAQAREEQVISPFGGIPYMIVRADEQGPSKREPGFYVRVSASEEAGSRDDWRKAIDGNIFIRPVTGGVSLPLSMGKWTSRFEVLVVANGKLVLANIHADESSSAGLGVLGEGEASVLDPLSGERIRLPLVESSNDFTLHEEEFTDPGMAGRAQLILVSIRSDDLPYGDGVTFAAVLDIEANDESEGKEFKFLYPPVLLDFEFVDKSNLRRRFQKVGDYYRLFSKALMKRLGRSRNLDSNLIGEWKELLEKFERAEVDFEHVEERLKAAGRRGSEHSRRDELSSESEAITNQEIERLPFIYVADGEVHIDVLPSKKTNLLGVELSAVINPLDGQAGLYEGDFSFASEDLKYYRPIIHGEAIFSSNDLQGGEADQGTSQDIGIIHMVDGRVFLAGRDESGRKLRVSQLPFPSAHNESHDLEKFSWHYNAEHRILVCSWKYGPNEITNAYSIDFSKPNLTVNSMIELSDKFFDRDQLSWRTIPHDKDLAFDHITEIVDTPEDYRSRHRLTSLHIHLNRSLKPGGGHSASWQSFFPKPLKDQRIDRDLFYREYETAERAATKTGVYWLAQTDGQATEEFAAGMSPQKGQFKSLVIAEETVDSGLDKLGDLKVRAVPLDTNFSEGRNTTIRVMITPQEKGTFTSHVQLFNRPIDIERLTAFGFIDPVQFKDGKERKKSVNNGRGKGRLIAYATLRDSTDESEGTYIFQIDYKREGSAIEIESLSELKVEPTALSEHEIRSRILVDGTNNVHWIQTPDRDRVDDRFQVIRIRDAETIRPRRQRDIQLQSPEEIEDKKTSDYERNTWRVDDSLRTASQEQRDARDRLRQASEFQTDVFPKLKELMDGLADIDRAPRHVALIVPDDLLEYVKDYVWALRYREGSRLPHWNPANQKHVAFSLRDNADPEGLTQDDVFTNMARMKDVGSGRRALFIAEMDEIVLAGRPEPSEEASKKEKFLLRERRVKGIGSGFDSQSASTEDAEVKVPHLLYLLANEGKRTPISRFDPKELKRSTSQVFIGSKSEWEFLQSEADFEGEYGLFDALEVLELEPPTRDLRIQYAIDNVIRMPAIQALGYRVSLEGTVAPDDVERFDQSEAEVKLMSYLVNRAQQLAADNKMPVFESFMRVLNELARQLTQNSSYRRARVIDRGILEKVLARIFPMPLNLNVLPPSDPLNILSREDADFLWLKAGYPGSVHFKERVIKTILSQLSTDDVRTMKSSAIITGQTGSTKTRAITTLFKMLGLPEYDFDRSEKDNDGSWAFVLNMAQVLSPKGRQSKQLETERMISFDDAKAHFDAFLASENGARGFIFLDDMHLAPEDVRAYFLRRIRALQDEKVYRTSKGIERPTRNISLFIAMNPTEIKDKIKQYAKREYAPTEAELILATLSTDDYRLDHSFLARWGDIINLSYFPASSKAPALLDVLDPARRANFANTQTLVFISPEVIDQTINHSPKTDARTFLSTVTSKLMSMPRGDDNHLFIIVPKPPELLGTNSWESDDPHQQSATVQGMEEASSIEAFIEDNFYAIGIDDSFSGQIEFLRFIVQNFRLKVFELILQSVSENRTFMRREEFKQQLVLPLSQAIHRHLQEFPEPFIRDLVLDAREFGAQTSSERSEFSEAYSAAIEEQRVRLKRSGAPVNVGEVPRSNALAPLGLGHRSPSNSRQHVLAETIDQFKSVIQPFLMTTLNMEDIDGFDVPEEWLDQEFPEVFPAQVFGEDVAEAISSYIQRVFDPSVGRTAGTTMSQYDAMRLLCLAVDKAISRLPWAKIARTMVTGLVRTSDDMSLGQSPHVQELLFRNRSSIFKPVDDGLVLGLAKSMPYFEERQADEEGQHRRFEEDCVNHLMSVVKGG